MSKVINNEVTEKDFESKDFLIRLNYVETSEPDRIAKDLQNKDQRIAELESLIKELEVYKKALELSIKKGVGLMGYGTVEKDRQAETKWKEQYLEQARKEVEDVKNKRQCRFKKEV